MKKLYKDLVMLSIFSIILSSLMTQIMQLFTDSFILEIQIYLSIYFYLFGPMLMMILLSFLVKTVNTYKVFMISMATLLITFAMFTVIAIFVLDLQLYTILDRFALLFKYLPLFILAQSSFNSIMFFINVVEIVIFLLIVSLSEDVYANSQILKKKKKKKGRKGKRK